MNMHYLNYRLLRLIFTLILVLLLTACGGDSNNSNTNVPVVVFSDLHFNPFYDPSLFQQLVTKDSSEWATVFQSSSITAPSAWGKDTNRPLLKDTNYPLLVLALSGIKQNLGTSPLVIFTGDLLGHGIPQQFYARYYANLGISPAPTIPDATAVAAMKNFTNKTLAFVMAQMRASVGSRPIMFAVGNSDSYSGYGPNQDSSLSPDNSFLLDNAELFYTTFLNGTVDHQEFLSTFTSGGYYSAEPPGTNLMVIGLNTILCTTLFYPVQGANDSAVATELDWFDARLAAAKVAGEKVVLLMHAPPGVDITSTLNAVNGAGRPITTATMMWWPTYQSRLLKILSNYPGTVSLTLAGHTHMDDYRILTVSDTLEIIPAIASYSGNNPAFKVFTVSRDTFKPIDYRSINYDLATNPSQFNNYYAFSVAYSLQGFLDASLTQLTPALVSNASMQALYRGYFYSGHNSPVSSTDTQSNPITNTNWPFYWCGIGNMGQQEYINCVNLY
jgi:sphingomyelin phosphodiesterase acid-like 3